MVNGQKYDKQCEKVDIQRKYEAPKLFVTHCICISETNVYSISTYSSIPRGDTYKTNNVRELMMGAETQMKMHKALRSFYRTHALF